jgi:hypothetical protein
MSEQNTSQPRHRPTSDVATIVRRLGREADTATVSLTRDDGLRFTVVGRGASLPQRYVDALAQLEPGEYVCDAVSTPSSVYSDIRGRDHMNAARGSVRTRLPFNQYEGQPVSIGGQP